MSALTSEQVRELVKLSANERRARAGAFWFNQLGVALAGLAALAPCSTCGGDGSATRCCDSCCWDCAASDAGAADCDVHEAEANDGQG